MFYNEEKILLTNIVVLSKNEVMGKSGMVTMQNDHWSYETFLTVYLSWCFPDRSEVLSSASKLWLRSVFLKIDKLHIYDCSKKMVHFHIQYLMALISEPVQLYGTVNIKSRCWSICLYKQMCRHQNNLFSFAKKT